MNKKLISLLLLIVFLGGCSSLEKGDRGGRKGRLPRKKIVPREEKYHPYGRKDYKIANKKYRVLQTHIGYDKIGKASWYGSKFHGRQTSTQEIFDLYELTAASPELPLPCFVEVTNLKNGRKIVVRINDRGPFFQNRLIDLSYGAAVQLGFEDEGITDVRILGIDAANWPSKGGKVNQNVPKMAKVSKEVTVVRNYSETFDDDLNRIVTEKTKITENKSVNNEKIAKKEIKRAVIDNKLSKQGLPTKKEELAKKGILEGPNKINKPITKTPVVLFKPKTLEVGVFKVKDNAENLVRKLSSLLPEIKVQMAQEQEVWRVMVGPIDSELVLQTVKLQLKNLKLL